MSETHDDKNCETSEVSEIVSVLHETGENRSPTVGDIIQNLGSASFGALLLVPAMIIATPASGIPGLPSVGGLIIALIAAQMVIGRDHVWLPKWLMNRRINPDRLERALDFMRRPARWIDHVTRPRLTWLLRWPMVVPLQVLCVFCGLAMPMMELVPMTSSIAAIAVFVIAVGIIADDGLLAILGAAVAIAGVLVFHRLGGGVIAGILG